MSLPGVDLQEFHRSLPFAHVRGPAVEPPSPQHLQGGILCFRGAPRGTEEQARREPSSCRRMAHWAGNRNLPDAPYATNAKWPEPWQPWQRGAAQRRKRGKPTTQDLHDALRAVEEEQADIERHRTEYIIFQSILEVRKLIEVLDSSYG